MKRVIDYHPLEQNYVLENVPKDIMFEVIGYLGTGSLFRLGNTNKKIRHFCKNYMETRPKKYYRICTDNLDTLFEKKSEIEYLLSIPGVQYKGYFFLKNAMRELAKNYGVVHYSENTEDNIGHAFCYYAHHYDDMLFYIPKWFFHIIDLDNEPNNVHNGLVLDEEDETSCYTNSKFGFRVAKVAKKKLEITNLATSRKFFYCIF